MGGKGASEESIAEILRAAAGLPADTPVGAGKAVDADPGDPEVWVKRLRRIERQVQGLERMVSERAETTEVLAQITAVSKGLRTVAVGLLTEHVRTCMTKAVRSDPAALTVKLREATDAIAQLVRS